MRELRSQIKKHMERASGNAKPTELAAIHATVLAIVIGVFSAFFIYLYGEIRAKQLEAMGKAEEINRIQFIRSAYSPRGKDVFMAAGPKDVGRLKASLIELAILTSDNPGGMKAGDVKIPEDPAQRAERILGIMNIVSHRYPFPKAIEGTSASFSQFRPKPIVFTDIETLRQWLKDLDDVITTLKPVTIFMPLFFPHPMNSYLEALALREKENIEKAKDNPIEQIMGEKNPYRIVNDFINGILRVNEIYHSTLTTLNRADSLQSDLISKPITLIILISGFIIFMIGVVLPLMSVQLNVFLYIHLPLVYYTAVYILIVVKIMRM